MGLGPLRRAGVPSLWDGPTGWYYRRPIPRLAGITLRVFSQNERDLHPGAQLSRAKFRETLTSLLNPYYFLLKTHNPVLPTHKLF